MAKKNATELEPLDAEELTSFLVAARTATPRDQRAAWMLLEHPELLRDVMRVVDFVGAQGR